MEVELSEDQITKICFSLWLVEILGKNKEKFSDSEELVKQFEQVERETKETMEELSAEQLDMVLEEYKRQNDSFNEQLAKEKEIKTDVIK